MQQSPRNRYLDIPRFVLEGDAACASVDPELFFPQDVEELGGRLSGRYTNLALAKSICESCPLKNPCLIYALHNVEVGVWGGTTESQREVLRRDRKVPVGRKQKTPLYI
jgi:WhiB family redox-sensing transcriptional regulator